MQMTYRSDFGRYPAATIARGDHMTFAMIAIAAALIYYVVRFVRHRRTGLTTGDAVRETTRGEALDRARPDEKRQAVTEKHAEADRARAQRQADRAERKAAQAARPTARQRADLIRELRASGMSRKEAMAEEKRRQQAG